MKNFLLLIAIIYGNFAFSQLNETFNDDDFTSSPTWAGSNSNNDFIVFAKQLRSNSTSANSNLYLSTPNTLATNCQWEFWVNLQFNPSSANYVDVYLTSDQANLQSANINGYFVKIGNTNDEVALYKRSGATVTKLIDGIDGILNTSNNRIKIRVTRTATNQFTLERDLMGLGAAYVTEGSVTDATFLTSAYFGTFIQQSTSGFFQKHFFDDISINPIITDTSAPSLSSAKAVDSTHIELSFDEAIDSISAKTTANYTFNNGYGNPVLVKTTSDASKYILTVSKGLNTASYAITVLNVKDKSGNIIAANNTASFAYTKPFRAKKLDLVINEIFADPSPQIDLPSVEFVELFNPTSQTIKLKDWKYSDPTSTAILPADSLTAGQYLILCAKADTNEYKAFGKTLGISPWPSLNNTSDLIKLISPENILIDSIAYADSWHSSVTKKAGGWSLERINPNSVCSGLFNWTSSIDVSGGTPGRKNSVYIENYDLLAFKADSMRKISDSTIIVYFNKPADATTATNAFSLSPLPGFIKSINFDTGAKQTTLLFSNKFASNTIYQLN
ncbi:MAG TPA: lamin tail domain-containing protein, partial [Pedobacter sp.]